MLPLASEGVALPIAETGAVILLLSLAMTVGWLYYLYR
ncbi:hypothetical protein SAMN04488133_1901 [Halobellus limi]|jgi:hypothetical protein|uniref:Uncharacterized protein n=1 Tax=Halobellus limi TaxID=699433 RepID=A0A1H5Z8C9_9EURY|nr:hypothetical protein SAMN04488133_1901 [Halobellus limi]